MNDLTDSELPLYEGVMKLAYMKREPQTGKMEPHIHVSRNLEIPFTADMQILYMQLGLTLESSDINSVTYYPSNATEDEQKNFPIIYAGKVTGKDSDGTVHFISRIGKIEGTLRTQDILLDTKTGWLIDGATGEFDKSHQCLRRLFDFATYAAPDNPPKKMALGDDRSENTSSDKARWPIPRKITGAPLKTAQNRPNKIR